MRYRTYSVQQGDTIQNIAQQTTGDISRWREIVEYNGLRYPYVDDNIKNPTKHVATIGDIITIPVKMTEESLLDAPRNNEGEEKIEAYSLGKDLNITSSTGAIETRGTTDETLELSNSMGELSVVSGVKNLSQALLLRLNTPKGSLLLHPDYGSNLDSLIGEKISPSTLNKLRVYVMETVMQDPRVTNADVILTHNKGNDISIDIRISTISYDDKVNIYMSMDESGEIILR